MEIMAYILNTPDDVRAMLAEAMMPDGFKFGGRLAGVVTVLGFIAGIGLNSLQ